METKNIEALLTLILQSIKDLQEDKDEKVEQPEYCLVLDANEAAEFTGLTKNKLYQYAREKEGFPAITDKEDGKKGRVFFSRDGLSKWIRENEGKTI
ncbi:MAG: helix-turn-helix domain-containing protein [Eubacterium sp.]